MSQATADDGPAPVRLVRSGFKGLLNRGRRWFLVYRPPFRDWRFWIVQALIVVIAAAHSSLEATGLSAELGRLYFVPLSLLVAPIVYAALNFGLAGSVATVLWIVLITVPNILLEHTGWERWGELFQMLILATIGVFLGQRVDRERGAREDAESASRALKSSETRYRGLFESSPVAILVLDQSGTLLDANPAAGMLFGKGRDTLRGSRLVDLLGQENQDKLLNSAGEQSSTISLVVRSGQTSETCLEPTQTQVKDERGNVITEVLLRDVTLERQRQAGLKAYAGYVLRGQEEERQRIARELHDETIQALVLITRRLATLESGDVAVPPEAMKELQETRLMAEGAVKGLRDFTRSLRPPILDDLGIVPSIRRLLIDFSQHTGVRTRLEVAGRQRRLAQDIEVGVFRIAQEALRNVERHSEATEVSATLNFADGEITLEIADNGMGFHVPAVLGSLSTTGQLGLVGMQERTELLGGSLQVTSRAGQGTSVSIRVPIDEPASAVSEPESSKLG